MVEALSEGLVVVATRFVGLVVDGWCLMLGVVLVNVGFLVCMRCFSVLCYEFRVRFFCIGWGLRG